MIPAAVPNATARGGPRQRLPTTTSAPVDGPGGRAVRGAVTAPRERRGPWSASTRRRPQRATPRPGPTEPPPSADNLSRAACTRPWPGLRGGAEPEVAPATTVHLLT